MPLKDISLLRQVYADLQDETTKISKKAFDVLDREGVADIITNGTVFYFEHYARGNDCPRYIYDYLKKFIQRKYKLIYLYDTI